MSRATPFFCAFAVGLTWAAQGFAAPADFQREVQPILAEHCAHCHGADPKARKAKLRLDTSEGALKGGSSGLGNLAAD